MTQNPRAILAVLKRSPMAMVGLATLILVFFSCILTIPYTFGQVDDVGGSSKTPRYDFQEKTARHLPPTWLKYEGEGIEGDTVWSRYQQTSRAQALRKHPLSADQEPTPDQIRASRPVYLFGTDLLGRDLLVRCLAGGGVSLVIGLASAALSVVLGTLYGALAGYVGGRLDGAMMRIVDVLYGLPYVLLIVLLAVGVDAGMRAWQEKRVARVQSEIAEYVSSRIPQLTPAQLEDDPAAKAQKAKLTQEITAKLGNGELSAQSKQYIKVLTLLVAIGGLSWLTMARVVRGQVLSLKAQPFVEAARAMGVSGVRIFFRHLLPNLVGPIIVYATLTVPQAILQESFLSFLGIGVDLPMPSWGNLASEGLVELNPYKSHWWMLVFPCVLLGLTLLALNFVGEGLREALDPKRARRR